MLVSSELTGLPDDKPHGNIHPQATSTVGPLKYRSNAGMAVLSAPRTPAIAASNRISLARQKRKTSGPRFASPGVNVQSASEVEHLPTPHSMCCSTIGQCPAN